jgi:hypothetical protein
MLWLTTITVRPGTNAAHLAEAFLLERGVADGENFVDDEDVTEVRGHGKREPHVHARGVAFHGRIEESAHARELDDLVEFPRISPSAFRDRAVQIRVSRPVSSRKPMPTSSRLATRP